MLTGGLSNDWLTVQHILHDSGAVHASYVSSQWLRDQQESGYAFKMQDVNTHVLLGDSKTKIKISEAVMLKIKFINEKDKEYIADVLCYVIPECPASTPIILGLPALLDKTLFMHFIELLVKAFTIGGFSERQSRLKAEHFVSSLQEIKQELVPWPSSRDPLSPEELETVMPDAFTDCLSFLVGTQEEAQEKFKADVHKYTDERWKNHKGKVNIIDYLNSPLISQTFLPTKWEGFKNVQGAGANANDEFELDWDEENLPKELDAKVRPVSQRIASVVDAELNRLDGYLWEPSTSSICCGLTIAPKETPPFIRIASDSRPINPYIKAPKEYIPNVQNEIKKMSGFRVFADIDQTNSFHQIKLALKSRARLAVKTPLGLRQPKFVPEGISPGSAMLQRINTWIFREMKDCMVVMFDNLLIGGHDYDDLQEKLDKFFEICRRHNVICKMAKSRFGQDYANFFGYVVRHNSWELTQERKDTVEAIAFPNSIKSMQSFLGMALFFKPFVDKYSDLTADLNEMTNKSFNWSDKSLWSKDYERTFRTLKDALQQSQTLYYPDYNNEFILRTDASKQAVGGILLQRDKEGRLFPIAMVSCKLSETAQRWDAFKLECFAIYYCVKKLSHYLHGKEFIIETDHQNLQWLEKNDSAIVMRWRWYLQNYRILIRHISGKKNFVADYFSRMQHMQNVDCTMDQELLDAFGDSTTTELYNLADDTYKPAPVIRIYLHHPRLTAPIDIKTTSNMGLAFAEFIKQYVMLYTIPHKGFTFKINDKIIKSTDTPQELGIQDEDDIEVTGEPYCDDGYSIEENKMSSMTNYYGYDFFDEGIAPKHFLNRLISPKKGMVLKPIDFMGPDNKPVYTDFARFDSSKNNSYISLSYWQRNLQKPLALKIVGNIVNIPVTIKHDTTNFSITMTIPFTVTTSQTCVIIGYKHIMQFFKDTLQEIFSSTIKNTTVVEQIQKDIKVGANVMTDTPVPKQLNPIYYLPKNHDMKKASYYLQHMVRTCKRTVELSPIDDETNTKRLDLLFDSGMSTLESGVSHHIVQLYPDIFKPKYQNKLEPCRGVSGLPTNVLGRCKVNVSCQHDITGQWFRAAIDFCILDTESEDLFLLSYKDCIAYFYDAYTSMHATFRAFLDQEWLDPPKQGLRLQRELPLKVTHHKDGSSTTIPVLVTPRDITVQPTPTTTTLTHIVDTTSIDVIDDDICIECSPLSAICGLCDTTIDEDYDYLYSPPHDTDDDLNRLSTFLMQPTHSLAAITNVAGKERERKTEEDQGRYSYDQRHVDTADSAIEVECKFYLTDKITTMLKNENGKLKDIVDIYYDNISTYWISSSDRWLRRRGDSYCIKIPTPTQETGTSSYVEITTNSAILDALSIAYSDRDIDIPTMERILQSNNIVPYARINTSRTSYKQTRPVSVSYKSYIYPQRQKDEAIHTFQIDIDKAKLECLLTGKTSSFDIGEVEMIPHIKNGDEFEYLMSPAKAIKDVMAQLQLTRRKINGKLVECIKRYNETCYKLLLDKGIAAEDNNQDEAEVYRKELLEELHKWMKKIHGGYSLHMGAKRTYDKACKMFPGHRLPLQFFQEYVASCGTCQKQRASMANSFKAIVKTLKMPLQPRACVGIDTLCLPADKYGNQYVHIIVQLFSKLVFGYVSKTNTADSVCDALITYFATHGIFNVMNIDPGANLVAEAVKLLNQQFDINQKISMVDVHTSNGVENSGVKAIIRHLQALTSDLRIKDRWSEPKYLQWCILMINNSFNSEIDSTPFQLMWGDHNKLAEKYLEPVMDRDTNNEYIKDLWDLQRIATEASITYQKSLHDKRVLATPAHLSNQYQPGDYVMKLRNLPLNNNKLQRLKYYGPLKVIKQEGNGVTAEHCSTKKIDVIPVERLVIFDNSRNEALKVAQLDEDEYLVVKITGYKGNPMKRKTMKFLTLFEDEEEAIWIDYSSDISMNSTFQDYCKSIKCLEVLLMKSIEAKKFKSDIDKMNITSVKPGDTVYVDLRVYSLDDDGSWYDSLKLPSAYTKKYVMKGIYSNFLKDRTIITIKIPIFNDIFSWNTSSVLWYGTDDVFKDDMVLVDRDLLIRYPQIN